jgi:hypothetical protein
MFGSLTVRGETRQPVTTVSSRPYCRDTIDSLSASRWHEGVVVNTVEEQEAARRAVHAYGGNDVEELLRMIGLAE